MKSTRSNRLVRVAAAAVSAAVAVGGLTGAGAASAAAPVATDKAATARHTLAGMHVPRRFGHGLKSLPKHGSYGFLLTLDASSTLAVTKRNQGRSRAAMTSAVGRQRSRIAALQRAAVADLPSGSTVLYRTQALAAGVAVRTDVRNADDLRHIAGVTGVYAITPKKLSNSYAVPHQGAPQAWQAYGDRGQNSSIAVIDTGIDYTHADFGGAGTKAAYAQAKSAAQQTLPTVFPTAKVVGGYDFVGDAYDPDDGAFTPHPDANPLDCDGHGTHVAGTAAGYGVNTDGTTYTGDYDANTPFDQLRIGPGMAPEAKLYAYRIFGCKGSTEFTGEALDRAMDPDGNGSPSDHVGVVNLSLGSDFVPPGGDADALLVKKATAAGVTVVAAAGNAGDVYDVAGTPADEPSAIAVAASRDAQTIVDSLDVTTPTTTRYAAVRSADYAFGEDPDLSGQVVALSAANATGCKELSPADKSRAAGKVVLLTWHDAVPECGSAARADNLLNANVGVRGFVLGSDATTFSAGVEGNDSIPGVLVTKPGTDAIRSELQAGTTVTVGSTTANGFRLLDPTQDETLADYSSRGVRGKDGLKPDVTAIGDTVFSAASGTGNDGVTESGTSMATPMTSGLVALVRSQHPDWTPEQVKADVMNTADQDLYAGAGKTGAKYAPNRVGAGRIDAAAALDNSVLAYTTGAGVPSGVVSASFGPLQVTGNVTLHKTITVQNTGATSGSFTTAYSARTTMPGATFSVRPKTITVAANSKATVTVSLALVRSKLTKTIDPTVARQQAVAPGVTLARQFVADTSGLVTLTPSPGNTAGSTVGLRVPVYAAPRPTSAMTQPTSIRFPAGAVRSARLPLTGNAVSQGSGVTAIRSTVAGFELQAVSGRTPTCSRTITDYCADNETERGSDLKYVGTTSNAPLVKNPLTSGRGLAYFAVSTQGAWRSPVGYQDVEIYIDSDGDGYADAVTYTTRAGTEDSPTDVQLAVTESLTSDTAQPDVQVIDDTPGDTDTALFDSDTLVLPVALKALPGLTKTRSRIRYSVVSYVGEDGHAVDSIGRMGDTGKLSSPHSMDVLRPGVLVYGGRSIGGSMLLRQDQPGALLIRRDTAAYVADKASGALLVHLHNAVGAKAQRLSFAPQPSGVTLKLNRSKVRHGKKVTASVSVTGQTGQAPTGKVVLRRYGRHSAGVVVGRATLRAGRARITFRQKKKGTYSYRVTYSGDRFDTASGSRKARLKTT